MSAIAVSILALAFFILVGAQKLAEAIRFHGSRIHDAEILNLRTYQAADKPGQKER